MKTESKIIFSDIARSILLAAILFAVPPMFSPGLYNSFRLPKNVLFIFLTVAALFFTIMYFCEKKEIHWKRYKPILIVTGIFFIIQIIIWISSASPDISLWGGYLRAEGLLFWLFLILYFILLLFNDWNSNRIKNYTFAIILSVLLVAGYGVLQRYKLIPNIWAHDISRRIISTMGNPLNLSAYLILTFPFIYYTFINYKNLVVRIITALTFFVTLAALYFTNSRSSWIAFLFANFILITFFFFKKNNKIFTILLIIGVLSSAAFGYIGVKYHNSVEQPTLKRLFSVFDQEDLSNKQRFLYWQGSFNAFKTRPIFGWGHDSLQYAFDKNYPPKTSDMPETHIDRAHNWNLDMLVMQGAVGWLIIMFILLFGLWKSIKLLRSDQKRKKYIGLIYIYLMAACLLQFFFMFALISPYLLITFALALVIAESYPKTDDPLIFKSSLLNKLKKNSNLYLGIGIILCAFIFFVVLRPIVANRDLRHALISQKNIYDHIKRASEIMPSEFYIQQYGSIYLKRGNEGRITGDIEKKMENGKKCVEIFSQLVKDYPYHYLNYQFLGECYDLDGNFEKVDETFQKAIENFPTRQNIYWKWGGFLLLREENDKAIEIYQKAIEVDPEVAVSYYKMSQLYKELGKKEKQQKYLDIAFEKGLIPHVVSRQDREKYFSNKNEEQDNQATNEGIATAEQN